MRASHYAHVALAEQYVSDVIAEKIPACKWVKLACERHRRDRKRKDWNYKFDSWIAETKCRFVELFPHTKGKWAALAQPFVLQPWQCFLVCSLFGWIHKSGPKKGKRRFTRCMLLVPRKNGKSDLAARIALAMFADDNEFGAEVYSGATSEKQAWEVFRPAHLMAQRTPAFIEHYGVGVMKTNLHIIANGSRFVPIKGKPGDGASVSCGIIDEYHEHDDDTLFDALETGMAAREQPLGLIISTAGDNLAGPCYALLKDLEKILDQTIDNENFWGIEYTIDDGDDWTSEYALRKANPNFGVSVDIERLKIKQREAMRNARKQGVFQTKHLDMWVGARQAYFNIHAWHASGRNDIQIEQFKGCRLSIGMDLASTKDIAALALLFSLPDGKFAAFGRFYVPEAAIMNNINEHYQGWARDGWLIVTDGSMIDYIRIEEDIEMLHKQFGITDLAFDPAYAQRTVQGLMVKGIPCTEVRPTVLNFSAAMKHLDGLILTAIPTETQPVPQKLFMHNSDPCFTWQMSNVVSKTDQKDNVYPNKERPEAKIDGAVALIMALNRALAPASSEAQFQTMFL
jgi:phage terminase large subunit-like protein